VPIITPSIELKESILVSIAFDTIKLVLGFNFLILIEDVLIIFLYYRWESDE